VCFGLAGFFALVALAGLPSGLASQQEQGKDVTWAAGFLAGTFAPAGVMAAVRYALSRRPRRD
jgi:hypothetical protein